MRFHLFGGGVDEVREFPDGITAPYYVEVTRVKTPSTVVCTYPASEPILEKLCFKLASGGLVANLYLLEEEKQ